MKLPKKVKAKWLKALRSGEYKQGTATMYNPKNATFCCLGVLEHVCMNGEVEYGSGFYVENYLLEPSQAFYEYAGIDAKDSNVDEDISGLIYMNDGKDALEPKHDFKQIANWIEKNIKTLD